MEEYLTITEVAGRLKVAPKTIRNRIASRVFREGIHYFRPEGSRTLFKWSAVVRWVEEPKRRVAKETADGIPMARGYTMSQDA
jgi:hypothetical protein